MVYLSRKPGSILPSGKEASSLSAASMLCISNLALGRCSCMELCSKPSTFIISLLISVLLLKKSSIVMLRLARWLTRSSNSSFSAESLFSSWFPSFGVPVVFRFASNVRKRPSISSAFSFQTVRNTSLAINSSFHSDAYGAGQGIPFSVLAASFFLNIFDRAQISRIFFPLLAVLS